MAVGLLREEVVDVASFSSVGALEHETKCHTLVCHVFSYVSRSARLLSPAKASSLASCQPDASVRARHVPTTPFPADTFCPRGRMYSKHMPISA